MGNKKKVKRPWLRMGGRVSVEETGRIQKVEAPSDEKVLLKTVPAKVDGVVVGDAFIYDDGSFDFTINDDAPQWAKDKIENTKQEYSAYSIGTDEL